MFFLDADEVDNFSWEIQRIMLVTPDNGDRVMISETLARKSTGKNDIT